MRTFIGTILVTLFAAGGVTSAAADAARFSISPRSVLTLEGSSNVARWRCTGTTLDGEATVAAPLAKINEVIDRIEDGDIGVWMSNPAEGRFPAPRFELVVPVASLRCSGGRPMERDLNHALRAQQYPRIEFQLDGVRDAIEHDIDQHLYRTSVGGHLVLAGTTRDIVVRVTAERLSRRQFRIHAELPVRMTQFRIEPPRALFGMIQAHDELVVTFDLILEVLA
ncbi:MAG TPA: YceI family protein [Thermoanaerobaculia bacterium]